MHHYINPCIGGAVSLSAPTSTLRKTRENKSVETSFIKANYALAKPKFTAVKQSDSDIVISDTWEEVD